jgi:hypothetical protein
VQVEIAGDPAREGVMAQQTWWETFSAQGGELIDIVRRLVHEGNVRRIVIRQEERTVAEFPLSAGVVGAVIAPVLAAVGALAALLTQCTIAVERSDERGADAGAGAPSSAADAPTESAPPS